MTRYRVSVDIGGTFTDLVVYDEEAKQAFTGKVLSTPDDPARGVVTGLTGALDDPNNISFLVHGTTVGLNAFLERRGTRVLLVTTEGFRNVYAIARGDRKKLFDLQYRKPEPLVPLWDVHTVRGRTLFDGTVEEPLREEDFDPIVEKVEAEGIGAVAVCFLHAYVNPEHERRAREILKERVPGLSVSLSHEVPREWREYERTSSAVLNAYIAPTVERYLESLEGQIQERGVGARLHVMQSNGGVMTATAARDLPVQTLLSGPVGGTIGGEALSQALGRPNLLCVDMGGTSFDASLIVEGRPSVSTETELEGLPVLMSLVDIHTIGAGGGSLAYLEAGALRVGPKSAGADPGPACYGRGGTQPTVTDANLFLGRMNPKYFLGGDMTLDVGAAEKAIGGVAGELGLSTGELAEGMLAIANAKMAEAMRTITVEQGIDPREYSLVAFGGAGPMHACDLAAELEIGEVIVPPAPGTFSAWGMLNTDIRHDVTQTFYAPMDASAAGELESVYADLEGQAREVLRDEEVPEDRMELVRTADMRYVGQEYFVNVEIPENGSVTGDGIEALAERFHASYKTRYGHSTWGAFEGGDGSDGLINNVNGGFKDMPAEVYETKYPVRIGGYGFRPDTGVPGRFRGGCGLYREYRLAADCSLYLWFERSKTPAWGLYGGHDATGPQVTVQGDGRQSTLLKVNNHRCKAGDTVTIYTGGGGGFGEPLGRDPDDVRRDVLAGYVTREGAERDYGVVLGEDLRIDSGATASRREELRGTSA